MMANSDALYHALVHDLQEHADPKIAAYSRRWFKHEDFVSYGLTSSAFREVTKSFRLPSAALPLLERLSLAQRLIESGIMEEAGMGNWVLALSVDQLRPTHLRLIDRYVDCFHSWATTDDFCINVLQPLLWRYPRRIVPVIKKWNRSPNRWKRRASVVAFVRRVGESARFINKVLELCEQLVWDKDDMVQKGVGWALKDNLRGKRSRVLIYIKRLRALGVPSTITLYAMRDLRGAERQALLGVRPKGPQSRAKRRT